MLLTKEDNFSLDIKQSKIKLLKDNLFIEVDNNFIKNILNKYLIYYLSYIVNLQDLNINTNTTMWLFKDKTDYSEYIYEFKKYNYNNKNTLIFSSNLNITYSIEYIKEHFNKKINYNTILLSNYNRISSDIFNNNLKLFKSRYPNSQENIFTFNEYIKSLKQFNLSLPKCKKYDFIIFDLFNSNNNVYKYNYYSNKFFLYSNIIQIEVLLLFINTILNNLNKFGNINILFKVFYNNYNSIYQLLYFISTKFKKFKINNTIYNHSIYFFIHCEDFRGATEKDLKLIDDLYNKYRKIYPENINTNSLDTLINKTITNVFNFKNNKQYEDFVNYINNTTSNIIYNINNLIQEGQYIEQEVKNNNTELLKYYEQKLLMNKINLAKMIGIELLPRLDKKIFEDEFGKTILTNIFSYDNFIHYKFKNHNNKLLDIHLKTETNLDLMQDLTHKLYMAGRIIDTRNIEDYDKIKKQIRYYEYHLQQYIQKNYCNDSYISRAFLKMYEIIEQSNIVNKRLSGLNTFFICEAPGAFIIALNHFIRTKTNIKDYNWTAQSLNPFVSATFQGSRGFSDEYKLMKNYPERWDFGITNTGDITDINNIKYYREKYENNKLHLVAGDCGIPSVFGTNIESLSEKLAYAQKLLMLSILKKGGNFILKVYLPTATPIFISFLYFIYQRFNNIEIYKSFQNNWSPEYYIIGKNYHSPINDTEFKKLLNLLTNFNQNRSIISLNTIPQNFMLQYEEIINKLILNHKLAIRRVIYYLDNKADIPQSHMDDLLKSKKNKNKDWAEIFKIKRIKTSDLLVVNKTNNKQKSIKKKSKKSNKNISKKSNKSNKLKKSKLKWDT